MLTKLTFQGVLNLRTKKEGNGEAVIYTYKLIHLPKKDKIRFFYALKGRNGKKGILERLKIEQLGRTVLLASANKEKELDEFFAYWRCKPKKTRVKLL
ncbi:hypothetical protein KY338_05120 [Candidatus Woesearchaeota archaeon]|nr:hypothetical protein [Candidatus Woesearchaeota archaeon]MBW3005531.1 hypothetical protein [Candidatus Woesearchaeota archaeon]